MTFCEREQEVLEIVRAGRWPEQCDEMLRNHVQSCPDCADLVEVTSVFFDDNATAMRSAHVPSSGVMWWRAQRRVRQEGALATRRVMTFVQGITVLLGALIALSLLATLSPEMEWIAYAKRLIMAPSGLTLALLLVVSLALTPVAVYFAVSRD